MGTIRAEFIYGVAEELKTFPDLKSSKEYYSRTFFRV